MKLTLGKEEHGRHIASFYASIHDDEFAHPELFDSATVSRLIRDEELVVIIAANEGQILGCGLGFPRAWNQSLEIGALSVEDGPQRGAVARALFEALRRYGLKTSGLTFFRARTQAAFQRGREIGAVCWGFRHDPTSRSMEDAELTMGFVNPEDDAVRVAPPDNLITRQPFAKRIVDAMATSASDIPYPKTFPVGSPRGTGMPVISGRIWPTFHSHGNYVSIESSAGPAPFEIVREFVGKVRQKGVTDVRLCLPANHEEDFLNLIEFGFRPVAYLPGWYLRGPHRFDCVEMVAGLPRISVLAEDFMSKAVVKILEGLEPSS